MRERAQLQAEVILWLAELCAEAYLVGGCVRDRLLRRPTYDLDVAVAGDALSVARQLASRFRGAYYPLDVARETGRVLLRAADGRHLVIDVARLRGTELAADLADRDFSINALAASVRSPQDVIDHFNGLQDLEQGRIRPVSVNCIRDDPIRALRALRQAAELGFDLTPEMEDLIRRDGAGVKRVSAERIRDELARLLQLPRAASFVHQFEELGVLTAVLPELEPLRGVIQPPPHYLDALAHSLQTVSELESILREVVPGDRNGGSAAMGAGSGDLPPRWESGAAVPRTGADLQPLAGFKSRLDTHLSQPVGGLRPRLVTLKLAALLHDTAKPLTQTIDEEGRIRFVDHQAQGALIAAQVLRRLRMSNPEVRLGAATVRHHMRPLHLARDAEVTSRAIYRFFRDTAGAGVDVLILSLADHRATHEPGCPDATWPRLVAVVSRMLADYWDRAGERVRPPRLVNGHDLQRVLGLAPGPRIGGLLEAVHEAQAAGEVRTRDEALDFVRRMLTRNGPSTGTTNRSSTPPSPSG